MHCPACEAMQLGYEGMHRHLIEIHSALVEIIATGSRPSYCVKCPLCDDVYRQAIKRGHPDAGFVQEFELDIRLVGMDILVQHLIGEHPIEIGYPRGEGPHE
ncbi:hypothetical protein [Ferrimicrobium acidiphilum]|uniref:hypothetical protein n=1 Tax=Ferrimicrobium acidiphilum TaxID=121039 RepID=UPI0023F0D193|nr:hypothetical protein [Ferrimicrobium acidiphilum]